MGHALPSDRNRLMSETSDAEISRFQRKLCLILGTGVILAAGFEFSGRMLFQFFRVSHSITGVLTLLAILSWGLISLYVIKRLDSAAGVVRTVFLGALFLALSQTINLSVHFAVPGSSFLVTGPIPLQPIFEEGLFVLGLVFLFVGFYMSIFQAHYSNVRTERKQRQLLDEMEERKQIQMTLERRDDELRRLNADLEVRIRERTASLTQANEMLSGEIARRVETEKALRAGEEQYRTLVQNANSIILRWRRDGEIVFLNEYGKALFGFSDQDLQGRTVVGSIVSTREETGRDLAALMNDIFDHPEAHSYNVNQNMRKDGSHVWITWTNKAFLDEDGRVVEMLSIGQDITARKRAEEEREQLQEQLIQAHKMESVGRLAGGVAHDFNNMLGLILGRAELALERTSPTDPVHSDLKGIKSIAERSANLTRQLLAFARKQPVAPQSINLNDAVSGMLSMLRRLIGENIKMVWRPGEALWPVKMDMGQLDQILANLCVNARDAVKEGGVITVETRNLSLEGVQAKTQMDAAPGDYVVLTVSDNGMGMSREVLDRIFEPFYTTKSVGQGAGLGLSTVYGIVKQNNGFIAVDSLLGGGTTFHIHLPRHRDLHNVAAPSHNGMMIPGGDETVLLVEDETEFLELGRAMLERQGYCVITAGSPETAIQMAREHPDTIHLLMTDVVLPGMNGKALAKEIVRFHPGIKCLFMSGYTADAAVLQGVIDGGAWFIQKPFLMKDLAAKVREALDNPLRDPQKTDPPKTA